MKNSANALYTDFERTQFCFKRQSDEPDQRWLVFQHQLALLLTFHHTLPSLKNEMQRKNLWKWSDSINFPVTITSQSAEKPGLFRLRVARKKYFEGGRDKKIFIKKRVQGNGVGKKVKKNSRHASNFLGFPACKFFSMASNKSNVHLWSYLLLGVGGGGGIRWFYCHLLLQVCLEHIIPSVIFFIYFFFKWWNSK